MPVSSVHVLEPERREGRTVVDNQRDLLHVQSTRPDISRQEDTSRSTSESLHNGVSLLLRHITVH